MKKLEKHERIAKLVRYNLISLFYYILILVTTFIVVYSWERIIDLMPLLQSMLNFGV